MKQIKIISILVIGIILGHLFGPKDPMPIHSALRESKEIILGYYSEHEELPNSVQGFSPSEGNTLKHDSYEIVYDHKKGTLEYMEPWVYSGFLRRLTFGKYGWSETKEGKTIDLLYHAKQ